VSSSTANVHVTIGGVRMTGSPFTLLSGASTRKSFPGINRGPVKIVSNVPIVAAERIIYSADGIPTSFSEMMALPQGHLDTMYWLPWYNSKDLETQLRFANVSSTTATVRVKIGDVEMTPFTLAAGRGTRKSYAGLDKGPVKIVSNVPIVAAQQVTYKVEDLPASFSEMMALPESQTDTIYWLPWYNNRTMDTQLRIANVSSSTAAVRVYIDGQQMTGSPFSLGPGASLRKSFARIDKGPVKIVSNVPILAAQRVIYKPGGVPASFSEMMALPDRHLDATHWLPWYNNRELDTELRFGIPGT
jgi:hypothetical protein